MRAESVVANARVFPTAVKGAGAYWKPADRPPSVARQAPGAEPRFSPAILEGDAQAYNRFLKQVGKFARKVAAGVVSAHNFPRAIVDDVVQETLMAVHQKLPCWDHARPLEPWVATVARNKAIDAIRQSKLSKACPFDELDEDLALPIAPAPEARIDVSRLMAQLTPRGREIVTAIVFRQESFDEVAGRLVMSAVAVRVALHRAIRAMRPQRKTD